MNSMKNENEIKQVSILVVIVLTISIITIFLTEFDLSSLIF